MPEPNATEPIIYKPVLLTYLDVLGFRERIARTQHDACEVERVYALLQDIISSYSLILFGEPTPDGGHQLVTYTRNFSDLIVHAVKLTGRYSLNQHLNFDLMALANIQWYYACRGDLIRGGMCLGDLYIDRDIMFGPALVHGYTLESQLAIYPRIIIDNEVIRKAHSDSSKTLWEHFITCDDDGVHFIDYLFGTFIDKWTHSDYKPSTLQKTLTPHKERIETLLHGWIEPGKENSKWQKILWLARYHNSTVRRLGMRFNDYKFGDFEITEHF